MGINEKYEAISYKKKIAGICFYILILAFIGSHKTGRGWYEIQRNNNLSYTDNEYT